MELPVPYGDGMTSNGTLAEVVEAARLDRGVTYRDLADETGIPLATLARRFKRGGFRVDELEDIARALGTTASALMVQAKGGAA